MVNSRTNEGGAIRQGAVIFLHFAVGQALRRKWVVSFRVPISVANSPRTQSTLGNGTAAGVFGLPELGDWPWDPRIRRIESRNFSISKNPGMSRDFVLSKTPMRNIQTACCRC